MDCIAPRGSPEPIIWWEKNALPLQLNANHYRTFENGTFLILNATLIDNGEYRCVAQNDAGLRRSAPAFLNVFEKPSFLLKPQTKKFQSSSTVKLECQAKGFPQPLIEWKKDNSIDNIPSKAQISDNTLILPNINASDEGEYTCLASNQLGSIESSSFLIVYEKPVFTKTMSNLTIGIESKSLTIECNARGKPQPVIYWAKSGLPTSTGGQAPTAGQDDFIILENGNLFIEKLSRKYEGTYLCQASNEYGSIETKTNLLMKPVQSRPPPIIVYGPQNQTIPINTQASLECLTTTVSNILVKEQADTTDRDELQSHYLSNERVKITWFKDSIPLNVQYPKYKIHDTGSLEISSVQTADSGLYYCVATNFFGQTSSMMASLTIENPNNQYAEFQRNFETTALPSAPAQPVILLTTSNSVSLSWQASSHSGHSPLVSYSIEYFSPQWPEHQPGWITAAKDLAVVGSFTVENLQPDTFYMFMIRARNSQGYGPPSKVSDLIKTLFEPETIFQNSNSNEILERALTGEVVQLNEPPLVLSSSSISITWKILKSASLIEGFYVRYKPVGSKDAYTTLTVTEKRARTAILTNLNKFTPYEILVEPFSGSICGSESNIVQAKTLDDLPSLPPSQLDVNLDSETSMSVKWQPPPPLHLNGVILGYKISCVANETKFNLNLNTNSTTRAVIVGNLIKDMKYCVQVAAFTKKGTGPFTSQTCIVMTKSFLSNFEITKTSSQTIHDLINTPWFILILVVVCVVALLLVSYCMWCVLRRLVIARKHKAFLSASSVNGSLTDTNHPHKIDSGNRYKLVTENNIWLDTLHSGSNQSNQDCCCVPDLHHQIFSHQHKTHARHLHHVDTCTQHTTSISSQPNSNNSSQQQQQPQYAEIYGPPIQPIHQLTHANSEGTNPYATSGLFSDRDNNTNNLVTHSNNPYNMINYQTLNANRQQLLQNSYTLKMLAEQLQADGHINSIGPAMTMLTDQKRLLKYLQQSTQSHSNTPRSIAKNLQNRVKSENNTNSNFYHVQNQPFHNQHQMIAYLADSQSPNSSSTPIPSLPLAPPPSLASALIAQQHTQLSAQQQKHLIEGYNNLLNTISRGQQQQSPVQYNMPWNGTNASAFTSARVQQATLMRTQQASNTFTAQQYANRAKQNQDIQQDYSSISPVDDLTEAELEKLTSYKNNSSKKHKQHSWASVTDSNPISSSYESSQATNQMGSNSLNSSDLSKMSMSDDRGMSGLQHYANHDLDDDKKNMFVPIVKSGEDEPNELYITDMVILFNVKLKIDHFLKLNNFFLNLFFYRCRQYCDPINKTFDFWVLIASFYVSSSQRLFFSKFHRI